MLRWLSIQGLALVESLELEFGPALNVMTGETGAGKSIVIGSIGLLLGDRADVAWLRAGVDRGFVEGTFDLSTRPDLLDAVRALDIEPEEDRVVVRRELHADGRSRALVNGKTLLLAPLRVLGEILVDLHGQHEHQQLLRPEQQTDFFDRWAGTEPAREALQAERTRLIESRRALAEARARWESDRENEERLREDARELSLSALQEDEEATLRRERERLKHRERLLTSISESAEALLDEERGAAAMLKRSGRAVHHAAEADDGLRPLAAEADDLLERAAELGGRLEGERDRLLEEPLDVEALEARLDQIHRLKRKHGADVAGLIALARDLEDRLQAIEPAQDDLRRREADHAAALSEYHEHLAALEEARRVRTAAFERDLRTRLARLGFGAASIRVEVDDRDSVRASLTDGALVDPAPIPGLHFAFQPNPGEPARPLQRIASGGELSRVMLSVKSMMAERDRVAVLVFDEVDQGIGGGVAEEVGALLFNLSKGRQVLCITHLPMIAAFPSRHFVVGKSTSDGRTSTSVQAIEGDARVEELARLLAGARATETTRAQAAELLAAAASTPRDPGARRAEAPKRRAVSSKKPRAKGEA
jgi:DNA repair protein RecN (Recombination protein N)